MRSPLTDPRHRDAALNSLLSRGYLISAVAALALSLFLWAFGDTSFSRILGTLPAPAVVAIAAVIGVLALGTVKTGSDPVPSGRLVAIGAVFLVPAIVIDLTAPFPETLNVRLPAALAYYPAAGFLAEVVFHLVPLAMMSLILRRASLPPWAYAPALLAEPAFQAATSGGIATLQGSLVAAHVAAFSAVQLWVFHRHGFAAMYLVRLSYYAFWHILWGAARVPLLFT